MTIPAILRASGEQGHYKLEINPDRIDEFVAKLLAMLPDIFPDQAGTIEIFFPNNPERDTILLRL